MILLTCLTGFDSNRPLPWSSLFLTRYYFYKHAAPMALSLMDIVYFNSINLFHQPVRFRKSNNYFLIVQNILKFQFPFFSVFQPFLGWLVASNVEIPSHFGNIIKILRVVDVNFSVLKIWFDYHIIAINRVLNGSGFVLPKLNGKHIKWSKIEYLNQFSNSERAIT